MPVPLLAVAAAAAAVPAAVQLGIGIKQGLDAKKMEANLKRPEYQTPEEVLDAQSLAERNARRADLPGQSLIEESIKSNVADSLVDLRSMGDNAGSSMGSMVELILKSNEQLRGLGVDAAQMKRQAEKDLMSQSIRTAMFKDKEFDYNKWQPFMADAAAISALKAGSMQNITKGVTDLSGGVANVAMAGYAKQGMNIPTVPGGTTKAPIMFDPNAGLKTYNVDRETFQSGLNPELLSGGDYKGVETGINSTNIYSW